MLLEKKKPNIEIIMIFLGISLLLYNYGPTLYISYQANIEGPKKIKKIAELVKNNHTDTSDILKDLADWQLRNIIFDQSSSYRTNFLKIYRKIPPEASYTAIVQRGACDEYSELAKAVLNEIGYECRIVRNPGEDHVWNEVNTNGLWVHFDSSLSRDNCYNNPGHYEQPRLEGGWEKNISYVYYEDINGEKHDLTKTYTKTGTLIINVTRKGIPIDNVKVIVYSKFLMECERYENYKKPIYVTDEKTNDNGICILELGENNYKIKVIWGSWIKNKKEYDINLSENTIMNINVII